MEWRACDKGERLLPVKPNADFSVANVGDNCFSETVYPHAYALPEGKVFLDTRGFFDTSIDASSEAAAAILTDIAVRKAKSVKVLWLQPYPLLKSGGVADLDAIGGVLAKVVVEENTPILFLFNKEFSLEHSASRAEKKLVREVNDFETGDSEEIWPKFQELALRDIEGRIKHIIETDSEKKKGWMERMQQNANVEFSGVFDTGSIETDPAFLHAEERTQYLRHFSTSIQEGRVQFIDPRFNTSISWLNEAIDKLPPASGDQSLNFTNYCDDLIRFREDFNLRLKEFVALLKGRRLMRVYSVDQSAIDRKEEELKKHQTALEAVSNKTDLMKYQEEYMNDASVEAAIKANLEEQERIKEGIQQIESGIKEIESAEPFVDEVPIRAMSFFKSPIFTLIYDKEPFIKYEEALPDGVKQKEVISTKPPKFEVIYSLDPHYYEAQYINPIQESKDFFRHCPLVPTSKGAFRTTAAVVITALCSTVFLSFDFGHDMVEFYKQSTRFFSEYFTSRFFHGHVRFFIESAVHNKDLIDEKKREIQAQTDNLSRLKEELASSKERKTLEDVIQHAVDRTKDEIAKLQWIKASQERMRVFLERKVDSKADCEMNLERVIEGCQPIVEEFFKQKDGTMLEFSRELKLKAEKKETVDVSSFFNDTMECVKGLEPFHRSVATLLEEWKKRSSQQ